MNFSLRWLDRYLHRTLPLPELFERLTLSGTEVLRFASTGVESPLIVIAQIISSTPHPNADRLRVCQVDDGTGRRQIVCGARNFSAGDKVPLALPGAKLPDGLTIKESKLRGELSQGMLCSGRELALGADAEGLLILPADAPLGTPFSNYRPGDTWVEVEITSNRPDLLSYRGLARELAAIGAGQVRPFPPDDEPAPFPLAPAPPLRAIDLAAPDLAPFYSAVFLDGVTVAASPPWLVEAIESTGHRSIQNVVDITNFVLFETGQPLHAFDAAKLQGTRLEVRRARAGERFLALDDRTYALTADDLVIADEAGPVALAGIMGGRASAVGPETNAIVLEAAWFDPVTVRRTGRRLGLSSDSSYRYERRVDPGALLAARQRAVGLLHEVAGARSSSTPMEVGELPPGRGPIQLRPERIGRLLGVDLPAAAVGQALQALGCRPAPGSPAVWQPPTFRYDLAREIDLIEELARLHGLAQIPGRLTTFVAPESGADRAHQRLGRLRRALADRGWHECVTDALVEKRFAASEEALALANPLSELQTHLRPDLRASLLAVAARNLARGVASVRIHEIGRVFRRSGTATSERLHLGLLLAGLAQPAAWFASERTADFFDLRGTLDWLEHAFGLSGALLGEPSAIPADELKPWGIKHPIFYAELALDSWLDRPAGPETFQALPSHPSVRRDLAVVVPRALAQARVRELILEAAPPYLECAQLFDLFLDETGEKIAAEAKSLAYALTFRAPDRTLTEAEVKTSCDLVRKKLVEATGCTFRE